MKTKLIVLFAVSFLMAAFTVNAKSKVLLRLNLQKGSTYEMTMVMNNIVDQKMMGHPMKMDQQMDMVASYLVLDVLSNKNFLIEYSMVKMNLKMNVNDKEMNFDSTSPDSINPMNSLLKGMFSYKMKIELSPRGQAVRVEGLEEYIKKISQNPQMAQMMQMFTDDKNFKSFIGQTFNYFPEAKVKKGDKWTSTFNLPAMMNMETTMNFEVASIKKDQVVLNVVSDVNIDAPIEQKGMKFNIKMTGTQNGSMTINPTDGWLRLSDLTQKFDMNMKMKNPQSGEDMEIPMMMNSVAKITVIKK